LIPDFEVTLQSTSWKDAVFSLKVATEFSLGIINQVIQQKADSVHAAPALNFLNHLFAKRPSETLIAVGRKYFSNLSADISPAFNELEFRRGIFQSVLFSGSKSLALNINQSTAAFWNSNMVDLMHVAMTILQLQNPTHLASRNLTHERFKVLKDAFKGLKFFIKHRGPEAERRHYSIKRLLWMNARESKFDWTDQSGKTRQISVAEFMHKVYGKQLRYPLTPLVEINGKAHFPMELCFMVRVCLSPPLLIQPQAYRPTLNPKQREAIIKFANIVYPPLM
jgi:hypothetical protein